MNNNILSSKCILLLGGDDKVIKSTACTLAAHDAIVFVSGANDKILKQRMTYVKKHVPGCSVAGTVADHKISEHVSRFLLDAAITLPSQDVLIYCPSGKERSEELLPSANRLIRCMMERREGHIINIMRSADNIQKVYMQLGELCKHLYSSLHPFNVKVTGVAVNSARKNYPTMVADAVVDLLCMRNVTDGVLQLE